jgi:hypothetical protein
MLHVDDTPETLHIYVVRDEVRRPQLYPIFLSVLALASLVALSGLSSYQQPARAVIRVPAVLLPLKTYTANITIIPTGVKVYPATTAHGVLTITNGSVIAQTIPQGFRLGNVITDTSVFVPAGSANGYGYARVTGHALMSGKPGNIPAYAINQVEGSSVYVRNLAAFSGGHDSYSVTYITAQDKLTALIKAREQLAMVAAGLRYPCSENHFRKVVKMVMTWHCQFLTYRLPLYMHVTGVRIIGKNLLLHVWFVARPVRIWVK